VFTVENDLLTPTFKLKRNEAKNYFISEIKDMYGGAKLQGEK
jgi:long-chain acyl-CoA synthetase